MPPISELIVKWIAQEHTVGFQTIAHITDLNGIYVYSI